MKSPENKTEQDPKARTRTIRAAWFSAATAAGTVFSAINTVRSLDFSDGISDIAGMDTLRWALCSLVGGSLTMYGFNEWRGEDPVSNRYEGTRKNMRLSAAASVAVLAATLFVGGGENDASSTTSTSVVTTTPGADASPGGTLSTTSTATCEIITPIADGDAESMKKLQAGLNIAGYDAGPTDGDQGSQTTAAVTEFKDDYGFVGRFDVDMCLVLDQLIGGQLTDGDPSTPVLSTAA